MFVRPAMLIAVLSVCNFAVGMGAFIVIGILNPLREGLSATTGEAGFVLTAYALAYAAGSPLVVALTGRMQRRTVLVTGMGLVAAASVLSALASDMTLLIIARVLAALGAGMVTPVTAAVALSCVTAGAQGKTLAAVFFGVTLAQVLGVPAGSFLAYTYGWQSAFYAVGAVSSVALILLWRCVPNGLPFQVNTLSTLWSVLIDWRITVSIAFTMTFLGAIYVLFTYLGAVLEQQMGYGRNGVAALLLFFGLGAVIGNFLGGKLTDSIGPMKTLTLLCCLQLLGLSMFSFLPIPHVVLFAATLLWSASGWSFMVPQQSRLVSQSPDKQNIVLSLNAAAIYVGIAVGAVVGGAVLSRYDLDTLGFAAALCMVVALANLLLSEWLSPNRQKST